MFDLARNLPGHDLRLGAVWKSANDDDVLREFPTSAIGLRAVVKATLSADLIHAHQRIAASLASVIAPHKRRVEHIHNEFHNLKTISFRSPVLIAVSEGVAVHTREAYPRSVHALVVPNGVPDLQTAGVTSRVPPAEVHLLAAGRLVEQKDPLRFLELVDAMRSINPSVRGTWVGEGDLETVFLEELQQRQLQEVVSHLPWTDRSALVDLMQRSTALVLTSAWEGLPLVALEAMSVGTPIVTTECGEISRVVSDTGAGLVWRSTGIEDFARVALESLGNDWQSFSQSAREAYEERFSAAQMARKMREIYER